MNIANIKKYDIANGLGVRTSIFVSGCRRGCKGCFNKVAWPFTYGDPYTKEIEDDIIESLKPDYITGLSLLGGDPFEPENQEGLLPLLKRFKKEYPNKDVWAWTGYLLEEDILKGVNHTKITDEFLSYIDVLVDGRFIEELKDITLKFRGSKNQRLINLKETLKDNKIVLLDIKD
jgi:anaerobic ribonucleoside-triphosphate reductase activating protein